MQIIDLGNRKYWVDTNQPLQSSGQFSTVYKAYDFSKRPLIIKKLNSRFSQNKKMVEQFLKEGVVNFEHPNIAHVVDAFKYQGQYYLIRSFVEGTSLNKIKLKNVNLVVSCFCQILDALKLLHSKGILHRDIKPANIIYNKEQNRCVLIDFGRIKLKQDADKERVFSLIYSPPEMVLNIPHLLNESGDLYSLALTLYETLTQKKAFNHSNPEILMNIQLVQKLKVRNLDNRLFEIIEKATYRYAFPKPPHFYNKNDLFKILQESQQKRYFSAEKLKQDLQDYLQSIS